MVVKMKKMALLLSTNDWNKNKVYQKFLSDNRRAAWRINTNYTKYLYDIPPKINLYFFHKNKIKCCALCEKIVKSENPWPLSEVPDEFHNDKTPYNTNILLTMLNKIPAICISRFPKWDKPNAYFEQGQLGILKVIDIR